MNPRKEDPRKLCKFCGKEMHRKRYKGVLEAYCVFAKRRKFCDQTCMGNFYSNQAGDGDLHRSTYHKRARRIALKEKCEKCGSDEKLEVHHVDCDKTNNLPENLRTLCVGCHKAVHREMQSQTAKEEIEHVF